MGLFDLFAGPDINVGVQEWKASKGAVLLDVRRATFRAASTFRSIVSTRCLSCIQTRARSFSCIA